MLRKRPTKAGKADRKLSIAIVAGVTGLGTMLAMAPASFASTLPARTGNQDTSSLSASALKISELQKAKGVLDSISQAALPSSSLDTASYQTQEKQQELAKSLLSLTKNLEGVLHGTPSASELQSVQSGLNQVEDVLNTPNLPTSQLEGAANTQGKLQSLVEQLQSIINDASSQYEAQLKNAVDDFNNSELPAIEAAVSKAIQASQSVYGMANSANNPTLSSALSTFSSDASSAASEAGSSSDSSSLIGEAELIEQNANAQLANIQNESKGFYDSSSSSPQGSLVMEAKNFDTWAKTWIEDANGGQNSATHYGYTSFLNAINTALSDVSAWQADHTLTVSDQADAATVENNLKIMKAAVETLQNLMENSDAASLSADDAYSTAWQEALSGSSSTFATLQSFITMPFTPAAQGGASGTVPESVSTYGGQTFNVWPKDNPFSGSNASQLWTDLSTLQSDALGNLPKMDLGESGSINSVRETWERDWSNYEYLQALNRYAEPILYDSRQVLSLAQQASAKITSALQLAKQATDANSELAEENSSQGASLAKEAGEDLEDALADVNNAESYGASVTQDMGGAYSQYVSATSSTPSITVLKQLATYGKSVIVKVDLPVQTTEDALYTQSQISQTESNLTSAISQAYEDLTGSAAGTGQGGLLGDEAAWQRAMVTQGVFNEAQKSYDNIGKVQQDLEGVKSASNPADATESLNNLQADLPVLISSAQNALESMSSGSQTLQGLNQSSPYSQSDISSANADLTQALPLASASNASNPIQKAIGDANSYNSGNPIVSGIKNLQPAISSLIGQDGQQGEAQKVLSLPFQATPASTSSSSAPSPQSSPSVKSAVQTEPAEKQAPAKIAKPQTPHLASGQAVPSSSVSPSSAPSPQSSPSVKSAVQTEPAEKQAPAKIAKPQTPHLASTGSDVDAAALGAAILLTVGVVAELLKNKKRRKNR
ncbi:MAG: hypothetical protein J6P18_02460 [Aeriscardovia sp.]|nr:hypothetical protein [Aeriscardovia sp.]